jgi:dihydropyrimidinase
LIDRIESNSLLLQASSSDVISGQDVGIRNGQITCIGLGLPASPSTSVIDAEGAYIAPGGVGSHVHLEQWNTPTGDTWETGSRSAICGGTTTVVAFASQNKHHDSVIPIFNDYAALAKGRSFLFFTGNAV